MVRLLLTFCRAPDRGRGTGRRIWARETPLAHKEQDECQPGPENSAGIPQFAEGLMAQQIGRAKAGACPFLLHIAR